MQIPNTAGAFTTVNVGSTVQIPYGLADIDLTAAIPASSTNSSSLIFTNGYKVLAVGLTSTQAGTLTIQRFLDQEGLIPQDLTPLSIALTAATPAILNAMDGKPFQSARITASNSSGSIATISNFMMLIQSY